MTEETSETSAATTVLLGRDVYNILTKIAELNYRSRRHQAEWMILEEGKRLGITKHSKIARVVEVTAKQ